MLGGYLLSIRILYIYIYIYISIHNIRHGVLTERGSGSESTNIEIIIRNSSSNINSNSVSNSMTNIVNDNNTMTNSKDSDNYTRC